MKYPTNKKINQSLILTLNRDRTRVSFTFSRVQDPSPIPKYNFFIGEFSKTNFSLEDFIYLITFNGANHGPRTGPRTKGLFDSRSRAIQKMGHLPDQEEKQIFELAGRSWISYGAGKDPEDSFKRISRVYNRKLSTQYYQKTPMCNKEIFRDQPSRYNEKNEIPDTSGGPDRSTILFSGSGHNDMENSPTDGTKVSHFNSCKSRHGIKEDRSLQIELEKYRSKRSDHESDREKQKTKISNNSKKSSRYFEDLENSPGKKCKMGIYKKEPKEAKKSEDLRRMVKQNTRSCRCTPSRWIQGWKAKIWEGSIPSYQLQYSSCIGVPRPRKYRYNKKISTARRSRSKENHRPTRSTKQKDRENSKDDDRIKAPRSYGNGPDQGPDNAPRDQRPGRDTSPYLDNILDLAQDLDHKKNSNFITDHLSDFTLDLDHEL